MGRVDYVTIKGSDWDRLKKLVRDINRNSDIREVVEENAVSAKHLMERAEHL